VALSPVSGAKDPAGAVGLAVAVEPALTLAGDDAAAGLALAVGELSTAAEHPPRTVKIPHEDTVTTRVTHVPDLLMAQPLGEELGASSAAG